MPDPNYVYLETSTIYVSGTYTKHICLGLQEPWLLSKLSNRGGGKMVVLCPNWLLSGTVSFSQALVYSEYNMWGLGHSTLPLHKNSSLCHNVCL